jgi:DNA helicase HerA-like ATPase
LEEAKEWFLKAREIRDTLNSSSGKPWLDDDCVAMLNLIACKNSDNRYINGYKILVHAKPYHSSQRNTEVASDIYKYLEEGKIIILDLSVGNAMLRDKLSKKIAEYVFNRSMGYFTEGKKPPNIVIYIEEAHNLIGKGMELTETWPRIAKEGAKYRIALVYATQEVSSVHPNILSNTENWFVSHLNSDREIKELARFYDFDDFSQSLLRSQDVGFTRVKTLSSPFVIPIQIDKFDPTKIEQEM